MERIRSYNYPKELGENIIRKWKNYKDLFGLEADLIKKLEDDGRSQEDISIFLTKRRNDIQTYWPELKKEA